MARMVGHLTWRGGRVRRLERDGAVTGLRNATEHLLGVSRDLVPIEEGTLERSGKASVDAGSLTGAVSYGVGGAEDYAVVQHERLDYRHDAGRSAKYLEGPLYAERDTIRALIAAQLRSRLQ